jgi:hypothetical protein
MPLTLRFALSAWVIVVAAVFARVAFAPKPPSVTPVYSAAALRWQAGEDLYVPYLFTDHWDVFRYPPGFAACFVPLTYLPARVDELLWRSGAIAVFFSGLLFWARRGLKLNAGKTGGFLLLVLPLALPSLNNGQANILLAGLLLHGTAAAIQLRGRLAGIFLALAAAIKIYPLAVGMLLSCVMPRRLLPWLVGALVAIAAAPFLIAPADYLVGQYQSFARSVGEDERRTVNHPYPPRDLYLLLKNYAVTPSDRNYTLIVLAVAAGMAGVVTVSAWRAGDHRAAVTLALDLGCIWMTVFGPATEPSTYSLVGPAVAATFLLGPRSSLQFALTLAAYFLLVSPIVRDFFPNGRPYHNMGPQPLGGLLLLFVVLWRWAETAPGFSFMRVRRGSAPIGRPEHAE